MDCQTLTLEEAADALGIAKRTAYRLLSTGQFPIPALRVGRAYKFSKAQLEAYLAPSAEQPHSGTAMLVDEPRRMRTH